jgi:hypothetical protein
MMMMMMMMTRMGMEMSLSNQDELWALDSKVDASGPMHSEHASKKADKQWR